MISILFFFYTFSQMDDNVLFILYTIEKRIFIIFRGICMTSKWKMLFQTLIFIGVIPITLAGLNIWREYIGPYVYWFAALLWIGLIGDSIIKRLERRKNMMINNKGEP